MTGEAALFPGLTADEAFDEGDVIDRSCMGEERGWDLGDTSPPLLTGGPGGGRPLGDMEAAGAAALAMFWAMALWNFFSSDWAARWAARAALACWSP